ncbi:hypothetical protein FPV67DRAFT_96063 [Lyophyllum atratum]|nr:hypothetical protein FPV67DRAFT_96063 [Lyophyllum atratum]
MTSLPQELIETIIDALRDDIGGLKACASVSRVWNHRSRILLLRKGVVLDMREATTSGTSSFEKETIGRFTAFLNFLSTQPAMVGHVQSFEIRRFVWRLSDERTNLLVEIMQALRHIRQLTFRDVRWDYISDALQKAFMATLRLPTLVSVDFHEFITSDLSTLVSLLALPPNLRDIRISKFHGTHNLDGTTIASDHGKQLHPLQSLSVSMLLTQQATRLLQSLFGEDRSPYNLKGLRRLRLSKACLNEATRLLLEVSFPSIEEFEIIDASSSLRSIPIASTIFLRRLPRLHRLVVPSTFLHVLTGPTYSSLDQRQPLEEICIKSVDSSQWILDALTDLNEILAQDAFGALRRVELQVPDEWWTESFEHVLRGSFPKLKDRGVEISVINDGPHLPTFELLRNIWNHNMLRSDV